MSTRVGALFALQRGFGGSYKKAIARGLTEAPAYVTMETRIRLRADPILGL